MKGLSVALIGAGFMALGAVSAAPAEAAQVTLETCKDLNLNCTQLDYSGTVTIESDLIERLESQLAGLPGIVFSDNQATATVEQSIIVDNLSGRLHDSGDTELTIPLSYAQDYSDTIFSGLFSGFSQFISLNSINIDGQVLDVQENPLSIFRIFDEDDEVIINGYAFDPIKPCLDGTCLITGEGSITTDVNPAFLYPSLPVQGSASVITGVNFNLTQTAKPLSSTDTPSAPEPSFLLASLLAGGGLLTAKRKQKK